MRRTFSCCLFIVVILGCRNNQQREASQNEGVPFINHYVTNNFPHDTTLFTEGFLFHAGRLTESTGAPLELQNTRSLIGVQNLETGKLEIKIELDKAKYFGEGIAILNGKLYQLTYKNQLGFIYDATTFKKISEFKYANLEGWGMTTDDKSLIMSDGTDNLTYISPNTMSPLKTISVTEDGQPVMHLNELEFIKGYIYANVYGTNFILKIDPTNGDVVGKLDLRKVFTSEKNMNPGALEMNGIAYDPIADKVYITGKLWAHIYEIDFNK
ncbi:glutaminyl-peptide cyclotransferase [Pedobacter gandavensis]|uniref:Glutaminyl-peptide cyclotransferase n=1 Tax=Pedobacter gandavensis TaxID=2679963 RepID=A0ABR6F3A1_9SPHI|nr:glutaminyl-peptide cyclotransferase [Pedobacter gandavensis]MBB2151726.1 glutaminyl-peptide cyclotransferase [Pedobacter gandavensis]